MGHSLKMALASVPLLAMSASFFYAQQLSATSQELLSTHRCVMHDANQSISQLRCGSTVRK